MIIALLPIAVLAAAVIVVAIILKKPEQSRHYDERQQAGRAIAYRTAFWCTLGFLLTGSYLLEDGIKWASPMCAALLTVIFGVTIFVVICIFKDAYFAVGDRPKKYTYSFIFLTLINALMFYASAHEGWENIVTAQGELTYKVSNLAVAIMGAVTLVCIWLKNALERKESTSEENAQ